MVKVREDYIADTGDENAIEQWLTKITAVTNFKNIETVRRACLVSMDIKAKAVEQDRVWAQEHNSFKIGLEMAQILVELELDQNAIIAAILYRAVREEKVSISVIRDSFGPEIAKLIEGVARMAAISATHSPLKGSAVSYTHLTLPTKA